MIRSDSFFEKNQILNETLFQQVYTFLSLWNFSLSSYFPASSLILATATEPENTTWL